MTSEGKKVVILNYVVTARASSSGSKCYLIHSNPGGGNDRIFILARSRGGRWIAKWEDIRRLGNFRCKTVYPGNHIYSDERVGWYDSDDMVVILTLSRERIMGSVS